MKLYNDVNADYVKGILFSLPFSSTWHAVMKMLVRLFRIQQVYSSKQFQQELFTKEENGELETKRVLDNFRMPKLQEIFTTIATVCHCYERLADLRNVFAIILL